MRRPTALLVLALASFAVACGSDKTTSPTFESVTGTWNLATLNGSALPFVLQANNPKVEWLDDQIVVTSDGRFTDSYNFRLTSSTGQVTTESFVDTGDWDLNGTALVFLYDDGSALTATVHEDSFTIAGGGLSQLYTKQ
jgi:hypothetical protein